MYTKHDVPGNQYLEYVIDPGNLLLVLYTLHLRVLVLTTRLPNLVSTGLLAPVFASVIVIVVGVVIDIDIDVVELFDSVTITIVVVFVTHDISYFGLMVPKRFGIDIQH